jgi:DNA repair protein NreA
MPGCKICGEYNCKKHSLILGKPVRISEFEGSSPPEVFVGRWNYPNVYTGILAPQEKGNTQIMSSAEEWHKNNLQIPNILRLRNQLIYGRTQSNIKKLSTKFLGVMKEVAMTHKSVGTEFKLKKPISANKERETKVPLISNAAPLQRARLTENAKIKPKVDYLVSDIHAKSSVSLLELEKSQTPTSTIIKILSAGLLGLKKNRKLVPTRWSITATDDTLSKHKLKQIKYFPEIQDYQVYTSEYLGNHYEFLLIPDTWEFEVMEISLKNQNVWHDHESFFPRRKYADSVTGAYYANRLAVTEHLMKIKRQASVLVLREIRPEYYAPLGVGILRETSRQAFQNSPKKFNTIQEALDNIQTRLRLPINNFTSKSILLNNKKTQTKLRHFF